MPSPSVDALLSRPAPVAVVSQLLNGSSATPSTAPAAPAGSSSSRSTSSPKRSHKRKTPAAKTPPKTRAETAPHRPSPKLTAAEAKQIQGGIVALLTVADLGAARYLPTYWTEQDRLQADEAAQLGHALYLELAQYPKALQWLLTSTRLTGPHAALAIALGNIAVPRLANHGVLPVGLQFAWLGLSQLIDAASRGEPVSVASGGASDRGGPDGDGQEHAAGVAAESAPLRDGAQVQAGPGDLP